MKIEKIDKNFASATINDGDFDFYSVKNPPIKLEGLPFFNEDGQLTRMKKEYREKFNEQIQFLALCTSGVCARFRTNSPKVAIKATLFDGNIVNHMCRVASSGFDVYADGNFKYALSSTDQSEKIDGVPTVDMGNEEKDITVNFPLYTGVNEAYIGIEKGSSLLPPKDYSVEKPVVFYGSSITQGGCASRSGNSYTTIIGRWLDVPVVNYGFSGNARGETEMAEIISGFDMSCFVMDYDYNAPSAEHLKNTHCPFFEIIRKKHSDLPVIFVSRANYPDNPETDDRRKVIYSTYQTALEKGDKNVYFVDGKEIYSEVDREVCTVDGVHPNDLGFYQMAKAICPVVKKALNK